MPCDQYELYLQDGVAGADGNTDLAVASLDQSTSTVNALQLGHINVLLDHKSFLFKTTYTSYDLDQFRSETPLQCYNISW